MPGLFNIPDVIDNPDGWGPTTEPEHLRGIPYAPYSKGDKVGRISDFAQTGFKYGGAVFLHQNTLCGRAEPVPEGTVGVL